MHAGLLMSPLPGYDPHELCSSYELVASVERRVHLKNVDFRAPATRTGRGGTRASE